MCESEESVDGVVQCTEYGVRSTEYRDVEMFVWFAKPGDPNQENWSWLGMG